MPVNSPLANCNVRSPSPLVRRSWWWVTVAPHVNSFLTACRLQSVEFRKWEDALWRKRAVKAELTAEWRLFLRLCNVTVLRTKIIFELFKEDMKWCHQMEVKLKASFLLWDHSGGEAEQLHTWKGSWPHIAQLWHHGGDSHTSTDRETENLTQNNLCAQDQLLHHTQTHTHTRLIKHTWQKSSGLWVETHCAFSK